MHVDIVTAIVIDLPTADVATFAMEPDNAPRWYVNIATVEWRTPRPLQTGSRIAFIAHFLGRRLAYTYEITELVEGRRLRMQTTEGPFPMETSYEFEPLGTAQCRMTLRNRGRPTGFSRLLTPFVRVAIRRANGKDLVALKTLLERCV